MSNKFKNYAFLHFSLMIYAIATLFSKVASSQKFMSYEFVLSYGAMILLLVIYAVLWQQNLKKIPLTIAFANKSITIFWGMFFGSILFEEILSFNMVIGAIIIIFGIMMVIGND